jgi:hypothetical protein
MANETQQSDSQAQATSAAVLTASKPWIDKDLQQIILGGAATGAVVGGAMVAVYCLVDLVLGGWSAQIPVMALCGIVLGALLGAVLWVADARPNRPV